MLRVGDEIVLLNDQQVVGWRVRALEAVMKRSNSPLRFAIRLSVCPVWCNDSWVWFPV